MVGVLAQAGAAWWWSLALVLPVVHVGVVAQAVDAWWWVQAGRSLVLLAVAEAGVQGCMQGGGCTLGFSPSPLQSSIIII